MIRYPILKTVSFCYRLSLKEKLIREHFFILKNIDTSCSHDHRYPHLLNSVVLIKWNSIPPGFSASIINNLKNSEFTTKIKRFNSLNTLIDYWYNFLKEKTISLID